MADRITVHGLTGHGFHGVYPPEREHGQTFRVDAVLELDTAPAAADDDLTKTVHYGELAQQLHAVLVGEPVDLLETLAQRLADLCLAYPVVDAVEITVHKPEVDLGVPADDVTVAIRRTRPCGRTHLPPRLAGSPRAPEVGRGTDSNGGAGV
ncbi:dihydroneopterin aldolase [Modestobacter sp. KNN46-3]|uniref:dihydroneopterin aldolase n=1 Tax=Modestobacter sp. KNN46-3 TaxID=2711218 RepID=UPI001F151234|nr:dihydroneopterin aldolase [Modestobacter sp. KNN46-3]